MWLKRSIESLVFILTLCLIGMSRLAGQNFVIKGDQPGIHKITQSEAQRVGLGDINQIRVFGMEGPLPQTLDSSAFILNDLPSKVIGNALYVYLPSQHRITLTSDGPNMEVNPYVKENYFIASGGHVSPNRVDDIPVSAPVPLPDEYTSEWFTIQTYHRPEINIIQSGRDWYGHRMFAGQQSTILLNQSPTTPALTRISATLMAQSFSESTFDLLVNGQTLQQVSIPSIPNSTYGIKGLETVIRAESMHSPSEISLAFNTADRSGTGYLKHLTIATAQGLNSSGNSILFRTKENPSPLPMDLPDRLHVWALTDKPYQVQAGTTLSGSIAKIAVFDPADVPEAHIIRQADLSIRSQPADAQLLIITPPLLRQEADRLAKHKTAQGIRTTVAETLSVWDGYGYGNTDPTALRNFIAHKFHSGSSLENVLLFGRGTFDYLEVQEGIPNLIPTYSSRNSLNPLTSYSSDDYFGFLTFGDGYWQENNDGDHLLRVGVGRIPATTLAEAKNVVDKIVQYSQSKKEDLAWQRQVLMIADDGDNNIHLNDAESHANYLAKHHPEFTVDKLYLDHFEQIQTGSAQEIPTARTYLKQWLERAGLLINYIGHGNETTLAAEGLFRLTDLVEWPETETFPLFVTATCEFGRHDSPLIRSAAEHLLLTPRKGAIGLLSTGRPVFSSLNFMLNKAFTEQVFATPSGKAQTLGEIFRLTKNNSLSGPLNRNFSLLGDPSLTLSVPELRVGDLSFEDAKYRHQLDTLNALQEVAFSGTIIDLREGQLQEWYEGEYEILVLDKPVSIQTLGDEGPATDFLDHRVVLHRGKGTVSQGRFKGGFFVGRNIDYTPGEGIVRLIGIDSTTGRPFIGGKNVIIGGSYTEPPLDSEGPEIRVGWINTEGEPNGTLRTPQALFTISISDPSGVNISPLSLGQDITLRLNDHPRIHLNERFVAENSGFAHGKIELPLGGLVPGENRIVVVAFDNLGNRSTGEWIVWVEGTENLKILEANVFPNPAWNDVRFTVRHNRAGENLLARLRVFSVEGREIISMEQRFLEADETLGGLQWFFSQYNTTFPVKGTYIYHLELSSDHDHTRDVVRGKILIR